MTVTTDDADQAADDTAADAAGLMQYIFGGVAAQVLHGVAALNIADYLADGPLSAEEVARLAGSDAGATYRLMRTAASLGVLTFDADRRFALTGRGRLLRSGVPGSLRATALSMTGDLHWRPLALLPGAVREGASQAENALGATVFDYLAAPSNAAQAATFAEFMGGMSSLTAAGTVAAADTAGVTTVVDVGGADGQFVLELMAAHPGLRGQVLDLPHAAGRAAREAEQRGLSGRFTAVAGDFFLEVPAADLYLLKMILHDWDDDRATAILRNCRAAVNEGGRALVVETVIGEIGAPESAFSTIIDMIMLCITGGTERDLAEFDALFAASGWRRGRTYPVGAGYFGMELEAI
jgi:hypothetical protein